MAGIGVTKMMDDGKSVCFWRPVQSEPSQTRFSLLIIYKAGVSAVNGGLLSAIYIIKLLIFTCIMFPNGGEWGRMGLNGGLFLA